MVIIYIFYKKKIKIEAFYFMLVVKTLMEP